MDVRATKVGGSIDQANNVGAIVGGFVKAQGSRKRQIGAIAALLIPSLDGRTNGAGDDGQVEHLGDAPLVAHLPLQGRDFIVVELLLTVDVLVIVRVLSHQGALLEVVDVLGEALLGSEIVDLGHELVLGDAGQGILDLGLEVVREVSGLDGIGAVDTMLGMRVSVARVSGVLVSTGHAKGVLRRRESKS